MNVGYARVSTSSQNLENQIDQLKDAGCVKIFSEKKSGKNKADRQQFNIMMDFVREGDILFITKLDRLARSVIVPYKLDSPKYCYFLNSYGAVHSENLLRCIKAKTLIVFNSIL